MTTAQVVETSVTVTNSSFQNYTHPDDHTARTKVIVLQEPDVNMLEVELTEAAPVSHSKDLSIKPTHTQKSSLT